MMNKLKLMALSATISTTVAACGESVPDNLYDSSIADMEAAWLDPTDGSGSREQSVDSIQVEFTESAIDAARGVVSIANNDNAEAVAEFLDIHAIPSKLTSLGPVALEDTTTLKDGDFYLVGITPQDQGINPISDSYLSAPANGVYTEELRTMWLYPDSGLKNQWLGIITLHEANHAKNRFDGIDSPYEEATTRMFQHELASDVFGMPYDSLVIKTMEDVRVEFANSVNNGTAFSLPAIDVEKITSHDSSEQEARFATATVLFDALFKLLDELGKNTLDDKQLLFDSLVYQLQ